MIAAWPTTVTKSRWPRAFALRTQKPFSALWKVTRSTSPASTSWVDGSRLDFIRIAGSSVLSLGATSVEPHRRRIIGAGQRADGARCRARTNAMDGRNRRIADVADRGLGRLNWAESAPTEVASGRTGVRGIAVIRLRARNRLHRPKQASKRQLNIAVANRRDCATWVSAADIRRTAFTGLGLAPTALSEALAQQHPQPSWASNPHSDTFARHIREPSSWSRSNAIAQ